MCASQRSRASGFTWNGGVPHPQARVTALLAVGGRAAPVLLEEQREALLRGPEVLLRVHRPQHLVVGDAAVEGVDEADEGVVAADLVVEARRVMTTPRRCPAGSSAGPCGRLLRPPHRTLGEAGAACVIAFVGFVFGGFAPRTRWAPSSPLSVIEFSWGSVSPSLVDRVLEHPHPQFAGDVVLRVRARLHDEPDDERVARDRLESPHLGLAR